MEHQSTGIIYGICDRTDSYLSAYKNICRLDKIASPAWLSFLAVFVGGGWGKESHTAKCTDSGNYEQLKTILFFQMCIEICFVKLKE